MVFTMLLSPQTERSSYIRSKKDYSLLKIDEINVGMGVDNLSVDTNGDLFAAGFPKVLAFLEALGEPLTTDVPSTIFRIRKSIGAKDKATYEITKALEDIEGKVLPGSTVAARCQDGHLFHGRGDISVYYCLQVAVMNKLIPKVDCSCLISPKFHSPNHNQATLAQGCKHSAHTRPTLNLTKYPAYCKIVTMPRDWLNSLLPCYLTIHSRG